MKCMSTHGASGYAPGSYLENGAVICGACGERIENPRPTGHRTVYFTSREAMSSLKAFKSWWRSEPKAIIPQFPEGE